MKKSPSQIIEELQQARRARNRDGFLIAVYELMQHHKSWLEYRYGTFDEQVEDGLNQALIQAVDHADFDSILHPETYFKQVAENYIKSERRKSRRAESLDQPDEENPFEAQDTASALNPQQVLELRRNYATLLELDIPELMRAARRELELKAPLQAFLLTVRAEHDKISYTELARQLKMPDNAKNLTRLRVQYLRGKQSYLEIFQSLLRKKAGRNFEQCQEALIHYLHNLKQYPPIPGISALVSSAGSGAGA